MTNRNQYIEPLIKVVELNTDHSWLAAFLSLRDGGYLPGGGAGSLNDWGPYYDDPIEEAWYSNLYTILRYLYDNDLPPSEYLHTPGLNNTDIIEVIRCEECLKSYQHPRVFESHISMHYFKKHFAEMGNNKQLLLLFNPEKTYFSEEINQYRSWLKEMYSVNEIDIYDFIKGNYVCPHCTAAYPKTGFSRYSIAEIDGQLTFDLCQ